MQVNSLGLTEAQPENNVQRIILESLGVTLLKGSSTLNSSSMERSPGCQGRDQQWSLRCSRYWPWKLIYWNTRIFLRFHVEARTAELVDAAKAELNDVLGLGGAFVAINELGNSRVASHTERVRGPTADVHHIVVNALKRPRLAARGDGSFPRSIPWLTRNGGRCYDLAVICSREPERALQQLRADAERMRT